jgi:hypothetical protein
MSSMGEGWGFHPLGDQGFEGMGGGEAPAAPKAVAPDPGAAPSGPQVRYGGATVGPSFSTSGIGRYYNRNNNGNQFNAPAVLQSVRKGVQMYDDAKYYRQHGFGAATRTLLGMEQLPSHRSDHINTRLRNNTQKTQGNQPSPIIGVSQTSSPTTSGVPSHLQTQAADDDEDW